jgi:hypothetical protein
MIVYCCSYYPAGFVTAANEFGKSVGIFRKLKLCVCFIVCSYYVNNKQDWGCALFGGHWNSARVLHAVSRALTSEGCFLVNHGSNELCGLVSLLLESNYKCSIQGHFCDSMIRGYCCNGMFAQWPRLPLLQQCVLTVTLIPVAPCSSNAPGSCGLRNFPFKAER